MKKIPEQLVPVVEGSLSSVLAPEPDSRQQSDCRWNSDHRVAPAGPGILMGYPELLFIIRLIQSGRHTVSVASRMCGRGSLGKTSFILNKYHLLSGWIYFSQVLSVFISESVVLAFILETTFVLPRLPLPHIRLAAETVWKLEETSQNIVGEAQEQRCGGCRVAGARSSWSGGQGQL